MNSRQRKTYQGRSQALRRLGFASYADYQASGLWKTIRRRVYEAKGTQCCCCGNEAQAIHHTEYGDSDMLGRTLKHLFPICNACHVKIEFDGSTKLNPRQSLRKFHSLRARYESRLKQQQDEQAEQRAELAWIAESFPQ